MSSRTKPRALAELTPYERELQGQNRMLTDELTACRSAMQEAKTQLASATRSIDDQARTIAERDRRISQQSTEIQSLRQSRDELRSIIADLEMQVADSRGYARALNERLEHDSPVVEVPHVVTTTKSALVRQQTNSPDYRYPWGGAGQPSATTRFREAIRDEYGREATPRRHWTAI